ncbi:MAG: hypothetical protein JWM07_297 [Candidatus Saccharibacteria bacterium]|nr:hypothetical protein [Candidatus Saccharibacteria bacterium]
MILILHIFIALSSVAVTTTLLVSPSKNKLITSYLLVGATLASGIYLTILNPAEMLRTCMAGLVYASLVTTGIMIAQSKLRRIATLAREHIDQR